MSSEVWSMMRQLTLVDVVQSKVPLNQFSIADLFFISSFFCLCGYKLDHKVKIILKSLKSE